MNAPGRGCPGPPGQRRRAVSPSRRENHPRLSSPRGRGSLQLLVRHRSLPASSVGMNNAFVLVNSSLSSACREGNVTRTLAITISAVLLLAFGAMTAAATTTTTPASGGTNVSADRAQNGAAPAFTTLGNMVVTEGSNSDFQTSGTLVLTAPSGWQFNPAAAVTVTRSKVGGGTAEISASLGAITASSITINITVNATAQRDLLTLGGIQVQAVDGGTLPASGNILRSSANPGTATIVGVSNDVTNFGSLSQAIGALRLF